MSEAKRKQFLENIEARHAFYVINPLKNYIENGSHPGDSLKAFIVGDLFGFFERADGETKDALEDLVLYIQFWPDAFGSERKFNLWMQKGGLNARLRLVTKEDSSER